MDRIMITILVTALQGAFCNLIVLLLASIIRYTIVKMLKLYMLLRTFCFNSIDGVSLLLSWRLEIRKCK